MSRSRRIVIGLSCLAAPMLLFLLICAGMGFAPFGQRSILIFDLSDQFVEFLCALKHGNVFFSWNTALGANYVGTFTYYVSSPFSLLTLLCPDTAMPIAVLFLIAGKLGLAGFTFSLLLKRRSGRYDLTTLAFSLCYALMAYNIAYAMSFMWLDGVLWLPVLLIGSEDLLEGRGGRVLLCALTVSFLSSWYISYMTGIFCALYLAWRCVCIGLSAKNTLRTLGRLAGWALLALALTAWLWLPAALSMAAGKLAEASARPGFGFLWPLTTLLYKLFISGAYDSVTYSGSAFLYCSLPALLLSIGWFFLPHVSRRAKLATGGMFSILILSLWFAPLDAAWHLFQTPNSFPGRWSFVVSCSLLILGYDTLLHLLKHAGSIRIASLLPPLLALVLAVDMSGNAFGILYGLDADLGFESYDSYRNYKMEMQPLTDRIRTQNGFERAVGDVQRSRNEPDAFGYPGLASFSSSYNARVNSLLRDLGFAQAWFWSTGLGVTPVSAALLDIGWRISGQTAPFGYIPAEKSGDLILYRSKFTPSVGYVSDVLPDWPEWNGSDPFARQDTLLQAISGVKQTCFTPLDASCQSTEEGTVWTFTGDGRPVYALFPHEEGKTATALYVDGAFFTALDSPETDHIYELGVFSAGRQVHLLVVGTADSQALLYTLDPAALEAAQTALSSRRMELFRRTRNSLVGVVDAPRDGVLYTSIPAIPGWQVSVDGRPVDCGTLRDTLLIVPVRAGSHTVTLRYIPPGLYPGLALCALGLFCAALLFKQKKL